MCGIAGLWGHLTADRLKAMGDRLAHRGPDDEGSWCAPGVGVGLTYRRLAIIDLPGGRQPVCNEDERVVAVFNGEIYNYRELREGLIARGHHLTSQGDGEVLVHLYEECGTDFVTKLRGMFAIALWDDKQQRMILARDRIGKKSLYYSETGGEFLFASEIKGVLGGLPESCSIREQALADYLSCGVVPAPQTIYQDIQAMQPGEMLVVHERRICSRSRYWQPTFGPKTIISRTEAVEQVDSLLRDAVRYRLRADVPVGVFLSGGIDSGIVTAMAARQSRGPVTTLTVGFEDETADERSLARTVADTYGTDHHELLVRPDVLADLPIIVQAYDQPFADSSAIPSYYIAQEARQHVKVVLNGDGGDELFAGYRRYVAAWIHHRLRWTGGPIGRPIWRLLSRVAPVPRRFRSPYAFLHRFVRGMGLDPAARTAAWSGDGLDEHALRSICHNRDTSRNDSWIDRVHIGDGLMGADVDALPPDQPIDRMLAVDCSTVLPNDLLVKMDIATMAHGLEARSPFLDHELIDVVTRYPEAIKLHGFETKPLLRELSGRYLPEAIRHAPKRGFEVPLVSWLQTELRDLTRDVLLSRNGLLTERFDRTALERLVEGRGRLDPARWSRRVWLLLMLGLWDRVVYKPQAQVRF